MEKSQISPLSPLEEKAVSGESNERTFTSADFDGLDPNKVFQVMKAFAPRVMHKEIPASYQSWAKLNKKQPKCVHDIYMGLTVPLKQVVATQVASLANPVLANKTGDSKNQRARLAHLREYAGAAMHWQSVGFPLSRPALDSKRSHESEEREEEEHPYRELTELFNNRSRDADNLFRPQNGAVLYVEGIKTKTPADLSNASIVKFLGDIDPDEPDVDPISPDLFKKMSKEFFAEVARVFDKFSRSGSQKGDVDSLDGREEWVLNFAREHDCAVMYSIYAMSVGTVRNLGKIMPQLAQRDSGLRRGEVASESNSAAAGGGAGSERPIKSKSVQRQQQREKKRKKDAEKSDDDESDDEQVVDRTGEGLLAGAKAQEQQTILDGLKILLVSFPEGPKRDKVLKKIAKMSGLDLDD